MLFDFIAACQAEHQGRVAIQTCNRSFDISRGSPAGCKGFTSKIYAQFTCDSKSVAMTEPALLRIELSKHSKGTCMKNGVRLSLNCSVFLSFDGALCNDCSVMKPNTLQRGICLIDVGIRLQRVPF